MTPLLWSAHAVLGTLPASRRGRRAQSRDWHGQVVRYAATQRQDRAEHARAMAMAAALRRAGA